MALFPETLKRFVMKETWTYAKTMPEWPHEYIVRDDVDEELFEKLVIHIRKNGKKEMFYQKSLIYYHQDGMVYWTMGAPINETKIINRCKKMDTYENRLKNGLLAKKKSGP